MPIQLNNYNIPISGAEFEILIVNQIYDKSKDEAVIEPNLIFIREITPSIVDYEAEFDVYVHYKNDTVSIIECKAREVTQYDVNKFHMLIDEIGLAGSNLKFISTKILKPDVIKLMNNFNFNYEIRDIVLENEDILISEKFLDKNRNLIKNVKSINNFIRGLIKSEFKKGNEIRILRKYSYLALNEYPGYYLLLNDCWRKPFELNIEIFSSIKEVLRRSIPKADLYHKKILEFIFIKACFLELWHIKKERKICTRDLIKVLMNKNYEEDAQIGKEIQWIAEHNRNLESLRNYIEEELGFFLNIDEKKHPLPLRKYETNKYNKIALRNFSTLYVAVGMDRLILHDLSSAILDLYFNITSFKDIKLYHTGVKGSIEAAKALKAIIEKEIEKINTTGSGVVKINIVIVDLRDSDLEVLNEYEYIKNINDHASKDSALIVTYIPKEWALYLSTYRHLWSYFFILDRPEYSKPFTPLRLYSFLKEI